MRKILLPILLLIVLISGFLFIAKDRSDNSQLNTNEENIEDVVNDFDPSTLSGEWVSVDDEKFIRKFNDDYTYSDIYDGEVTSSGIWFGFDKNSAPENFPYDMEEGKTYIVINDTSTTLAFMISSVSNDKLELFYLDGGLLQFNKK